MTPTPEQLAAQLDLLQRRVVDLEGQLRTRRRKGWALALATCLAAGLAGAASGTCPNPMPFCFAPDTPALASQVNHNFMQLKEWLEQKVGGTGTGNVTINGAVRVSSSSWLVTGAINDGTTNGGGFDFRHDNQTQGLGIGFNTLYASGTTANQDVNLKPRGSGVVNVLGDLTVTANGWGAGPTLQNWVSRGVCATSATRVPTTYRCPAGQYVCGIQFNHGCAAEWWTEEVALECCGL